MNPFHLALPVHDLDAARRFYGVQLGCVEGRCAERWIDFNFFGHQLSVHLVDEIEEAITNSVDGDKVPTRHFGIILDWADWESIQSRFTDYLLAPKIRFQGQVGEQGTFFVRDPSGNALEFNAWQSVKVWHVVTIRLIPLDLHRLHADCLKTSQLFSPLAYTERSLI